MNKKPKHVLLAGTFDHLHSGHCYFINAALKNASFVSCGLTTGWANKSKVCENCIQSFNQRYKTLKSYLNSQPKKAYIFRLNDPFGPSINTNVFDVIAVTQESYTGAVAINKIRKSKGLNPLPIITLKLVMAGDNKKISSSRIRLGEINRQGLVYKNTFSGNNNLFLPPQNRIYFKKPIGKLITSTNQSYSWAANIAVKWISKFKPSYVITVGDIATQSILLNKFIPDLAIFDQRCQRQPISFDLHKQLKHRAFFHLKSRNMPGSITTNVIKNLQKAYYQLITTNKNGVIEVVGEEDLLVLPIILLFPLKTVIFYGQPQKGLVKVVVTEKVKSLALNLMSKFRS